MNYSGCFFLPMRRINRLNSPGRREDRNSQPARQPCFAATERKGLSSHEPAYAPGNGATAGRNAQKAQKRIHGKGSDSHRCRQRTLRFCFNIVHLRKPGPFLVTQWNMVSSFAILALLRGETLIGEIKTITQDEGSAAKMRKRRKNSMQKGTEQSAPPPTGCEILLSHCSSHPIGSVPWQFAIHSPFAIFAPFRG